MNDEPFLILSDGAFTGHANVAGGYAEALGELAERVNHRIINPVTDLEIETRSLSPDTTLIQCFIPPSLEPVPGVRNIALVFHEWSRMPAGWVRKLEQFDQVWVASTYNRQVLRESGFSGTVHYIPAYIEAGGFKQKKSWEAGETFRFLSVGEWHFRKGFHLLAASFEKAFPEEENVELHIKTFGHGGFSFGDPRIRIIDENLETEAMRNLYSRFDAYATASLAEGLGLPVGEAMASKLPVVAVNWSGLTEFCSQDTIVEIPFRLSAQPYCSRPDYYAPGQQCAVADLHGCAEALRRMVALPPADRQSMAQKALAGLVKENSKAAAANAIKFALKAEQGNTVEGDEE